MSLPGDKRKGLVGADEGQTPSGKGLSLPRVSSTGRQLHPVRHPAGHGYHSAAIPVEEGSFDSGDVPLGHRPLHHGYYSEAHES